MKNLDLTACPNWGKAGRFVIVDGVRMPVVAPGAAATTEHLGAATGEPRTAVAGDTLESPAADAPVVTQPAKKGK